MAQAFGFISEAIEIEDKKLKASENIKCELRKRTQALKVKITSMSLAIYHNKMYTLVDIDSELLEIFTSLDRMLFSIDKLTGTKSSIHNTIKSMKMKLINLKIAIETTDFPQLKVITLDYLKDIDKIMAEI